MKKRILICSFFLLLSFNLFSQEVNWKEEYIILMDEFEETVEQLKGSNEDYEKLLSSYDILIEDYETLFGLYSKKQVIVEKSLSQIEADQIETETLIETIETLTKYVEPKYFTAFADYGMVNKNQAFDIGLVVDIPRIPVSVIASGGYVIDVGTSFKIGLGVQF